jgi:hypothetical protein
MQRSKSSSPENLKSNGFFEDHYHSLDSNLVNGGYVVPAHQLHYANSSSARLNSLQRALWEAEATLTCGLFDCEKGEKGTGVQSLASSIESRFKSPPLPAGTAARRVGCGPAALGTSALQNKTWTGPGTSNNSEMVKRLHGNPSAAMRRVSSASGFECASLT